VPRLPCGCNWSRCGDAGAEQLAFDMGLPHVALFGAFATAVAAQSAPLPYRTDAPLPLRKNAATTPRAAKAWTPRPVQGDRRLSHGAPHCVQNEAFVDDACDLCYGGCHACWVYLSDSNEVACVDESVHESWDGMATCLNEDSVPNRATKWCGATPAPTYLYCESGYVEDCEGGHCCPESWVGNGDCDDHYEFLVHCDLSCYADDGGDCVETPEPTSVPFEGCCFWSSSGDSCGDCDQPAANVDWCSFSRANCESCSNAEWCGESDLAPHAPAPSVQPSPRPTDAQTVDGRIILPDGVSCGGGTHQMQQSCETCSGYIDGRYSPLQNCVYGVGTNGRWHCKNEGSGDILELDNSCFETPEPSAEPTSGPARESNFAWRLDDSPVYRTQAGADARTDAGAHDGRDDRFFNKNGRAPLARRRGQGRAPLRPH
jgi:hypothetical protein